MDDLEKLLREKLDFLESELVKLSDPNQKFAVIQQIEDVQRRLDEIRQDATPPSAEDEAPVPRRIRVWPREPPPLPELPYPVLLPYEHPALFAGRDRDLDRLRNLLRAPMPILGLAAPSGAGKSSLILAALAPAWRAEGRPLAVVRHPAEPGVAGRLLGQLLEAGADVDDSDWGAFAARLDDVARLAGEPPLLVLDQLEDVLHPSATAARAVLGPLLAATVRGISAGAAPRCRWLLGLREEFLGDLFAWLGDVTDGIAGADHLPSDLSGPERFHSTSLAPLGTAPAGCDALEEATRIFLAAIERPLAASADGGARVYPWRFADGHAERLASAFAEARRSRPDAPLTPELQVVLAHLLDRAGEGEVRVPDDAVRMVDEALEDHLRHALETAYPGERARIERARALLALHQLTSEGVRRVGLRGDDLSRASPGILDKLTTPWTRLLVAQQAEDGTRYVLPHDRMVEVVRQVVENEERRGRLIVDREFLELRRVVALKLKLWRSFPVHGTDLSSRQFHLITANEAALLWDAERREWWQACRWQRSYARRRVAMQALAAFVLVGLVVAWAVYLAREPNVLEERLDLIAEGTVDDAVTNFQELLPDIDEATLSSRLAQRKLSMDVLEAAVGKVPGLTVLKMVTSALPSVERTPEDPFLLARLAWALDFTAAQEPKLASEAWTLHRRVFGPLRRQQPLPEMPSRDPDWIDVPAGTFLMGGPRGERPQHAVTLSAFRMLRHEVTNDEYRRLVPDHAAGKAGNLPATEVSWYEAYTYAAWLGGRLPTEAEWEYAARAGCPHPYCRPDGSASDIREIAWVGEGFDQSAHPVMKLESNPWGLFDMLGNVSEWTADPYSGDPRMAVSGPWVAPSGLGRVIRGGSSWDNAAGTRVEDRGWGSPVVGHGDLGFRVVLPGRPTRLFNP